MNLIHLIRFKTSDQGTRGMLFLPSGEHFATLELPWRENQQSISCIPQGTYQAEMIDTSSRGRVYWLKEVPGRSEILIHSGNWAGDVSKGFYSDSEGCILPGMKHGHLWRNGKEQDAVISSRVALGQLRDILEEQKIMIKILGGHD